MLRRNRNLVRTDKRHLLIRQRRRLGVFYAEQLRMCQVKKPKVVVLTGAGISAESGIQTFRASDGLWEQHRVEDVATPEGFQRNPQLVQAFYNERRHQLQQENIKPNLAHLALAELEQYLGENFLLVTQNIDNLHERAGSQNIIHMHGELLKVRCIYCDEVYDWQGPLAVEQSCDKCHQPYALRPHIVWFGEMPFEMDKIYQALEQADYFIAIGTSGHVYPAAGFVEYAKQHGVYTVELNLEPSQIGSQFDEGHYGLATEVVSNFVASKIQKCC